MEPQAWAKLPRSPTVAAAHSLTVRMSRRRYRRNPGRANLAPASDLAPRSRPRVWYGAAVTVRSFAALAFAGVCACAPPPASVVDVVVARAVLDEARASASELVARGERTSDPTVVRRGTELLLGADNVRRAIGDLDRTLVALPEDARHAISAVRRATKDARGASSPTWDLAHASTIDAREEADVFLRRDLFLVREIRGAAFVADRRDHTVTVIASGFGDGVRGPTVQASVEGRPLDAAHLTRKAPDELGLVLTADMLALPTTPGRLRLVHVDLRVSRTVRKGEWPFWRDEPESHEIAFVVAVVPPEAGRLEIEARIPHPDAGDELRHAEVDVAWGGEASVVLPPETRSARVTGRLANGEDVRLDLPGPEGRGAVTATLDLAAAERRLRVRVGDLR